MASTKICAQCLLTLSGLAGPRRLLNSKAILRLRMKHETQSRQMSWLGNLFSPTSPSSTSSERHPEPPKHPPSPFEPAPSTNKSTPEVKLKQALEKAAEKRNTITLNQQKQLEHQLLAWGESDVPSSLTALPFQNPLGHLPLSDQKSYFANPPNAYIETLEERARVRESYEKEMFNADPIKHWRLAYSTKPDFAADELPLWKKWSPEKRLEVMEKYRRYDERFQNKVHLIYKNYETPFIWEKAKASVILKVQRESVAARQKKKVKYVEGKKDWTEKVVIEEPPLSIVERRVFRTVVRQRNDALNRLWHLHLAEVSVFEDLTKEGVTLSEERRRKVPVVREQRNLENEKVKKALKDWSTMPNENKVETVNWGAIHSET